MLKIALGDLRHNSIGRHSFYMPIGIGYIASYLKAHSDSDNIEIRLYDDPDNIIRDIDNWKPKVIGLSHYCWNSQLSSAVFNYAKKVNPGTICVAGGPEFPVEPEECRNYLLRNPEIDFYIYREGEIAFSNLIQKIQKETAFSHIKNNAQEGVMAINSETKDLIVGKPISRLSNLDDIPSPYLNGLMDQWFNGYYAPAIQTTRGCPFSCGYCRAGQSFNNIISRFSTKRIEEELIYIAQRIRAYPNILLLICDSNFGMFEQDEVTAKFLKALNDEYGWPNNFNVTTGKANYDRTLRISSLLKNRIHVSTSLQSLNPLTLEVIKRKNPPLDEYHEIQNEIKRRGMLSIGELIVPLPEETRESFFGGVKFLFEEGVEDIIPYTAMMLKGTHLDSQECRRKYQMQTKFRLLPRQFGEYAGKRCFEAEEVCVATNSMTFEDYLDCRGFSMISSLLSNEQFDLLHRHLKELKVDSYDYLYYVWGLVSSGKTELSKTYSDYIEETKAELWDNEDELYKHFEKGEAYNKLLTGALGDNLIRKYKTKILYEHFILTTNLLYSAIETMIGKDITVEIKNSLNAAKSWMISIRDIDGAFQKDFCDKKILDLDYDVNSWYITGSNSDVLTSYKVSSRYKVFYDIKKLEMITKESKMLFGEDLSFRIGKLLINWSIKNFWRRCEPVA